MVFSWRTVLSVFYGELRMPQLKQAPSESHKSDCLCCFHQLMRLKFLVAAVCCACCRKQRDTDGPSYACVVFFFNRKMTISKNALKLSSKTLSSLTERSKCGGHFF